MDATTAAVLRVWAAANTPSRVLTLIDVASSMGSPAGYLGESRLSVTQQAAAAGLSLFTADSQVGIWAFAPGIGASDVHELTGVAPLTAGGGKHLLDLTKQIAKVRPLPVAGCGLYPAITAAYRNMLDNYAVGRINTIVVFTDCAAADPGQMSLEALETTLQSLADVTRPIPVVLIDVGPGSNDRNLAGISSTIGGGDPFDLAAPAEIQKIFLGALVNVG